MALLAQGLAASIVVMLRRLWRAGDGRAEQVAIGIGARMGNGLLILALAFLVLRSRGASATDQALVAFVLAAAFFSNFIALASRPEDVLIGYKG